MEQTSTEKEDMIMNLEAMRGVKEACNNCKHAVVRNGRHFCGKRGHITTSESICKMWERKEKNDK